MKLQITHLAEGENHLHFDSSLEPWANELLKTLETEGYRVRGPLVGDLYLTKLEPDYYLKGRLAFEVEQPCSRCAESFNLPILHDFELALAHVGPGTSEKGSISEESEELDVTYFTGPELDLAPVVAEEFRLSIPFKALCNENCRGICQKCGKNLNVEQCHCVEESGSHPFSVLKKFKL